VDRDAILRAVEAERRDLADLLDRLAPADWDVESLCADWTVRDVVAHLTLVTRLSKPAAVLGVLRARGDIHKMIGDAARRRAAEFTPAELVAQLRATAGSARRPLVAQPPDPLVDILVHGQDIARPLGRPTDAARACAAGAPARVEQQLLRRTQALRGPAVRRDGRGLVGGGGRRGPGSERRAAAPPHGSVGRPRRPGCRPGREPAESLTTVSARRSDGDPAP
jgi:uncharacterized protein (TIGR03083 family)